MFELITSKISNPKLRWASLASSLECDLNALNKAFGVPKKVQELSFIYRKLYEFTVKQGVDVGNHEVLAFIEDVDALRRNERFNKALMRINKLLIWILETNYNIQKFYA